VTAQREALAIFQQEEKGVLRLDVNLRVVAGFDEFAVAVEHRGGQLRSLFHGAAQRRRGELAERGQHGIDVRDVEARQQAPQQIAEGLAHGAAGYVGFGNQGGGLVGERQARQRRAQLVDRRRGQFDPAHRLRAGLTAHLQFRRLVLGVEDPRVVDLGEVVVFGGQPENRHGGETLRGEPFRQAGGVQRFVNGVGGAGEQPDLLARGDRQRAWLRQALQGRARRILHPQGFHQRGAPLRRQVHCASRRLERRQIAQRVMIETRRAIRMIRNVRGQTRDTGQFGLADAATGHDGSHFT